MNKMTLGPLGTRNILNVIGAVVDEFRLMICSDSWKVKAVDPANVAMISVDLPRSEFLDYECDLKDDPLIVGVDVDKVKNFLVGASPQEDIMIGDELTWPVEFSFFRATDNVHKGNRYQMDITQGIYSQSILLYPENEIRKGPKLPGALVFDHSLQLNTLELQRMIKKASKVSDYISFNVRRCDDTIVFTASTEDENGCPWIAKPQANGCASFSDRTDISSLYSLDYLQDIVKVIPSDKTWLNLGNDMPCKLVFHIGSMGRGRVEYCQAPRIESE